MTQPIENKTISKLDAIQIFSALVNVNGPDKIIEEIGGERTKELCDIIKDATDNKTKLELVINSIELVKRCANIILDDDEDLPTRFEVSE